MMLTVMNKMKICMIRSDNIFCVYITLFGNLVINLVVNLVINCNLYIRNHAFKYFVTKYLKLIGSTQHIYIYYLLLY